MNYDPLLSDWISGSQKLALPGAINPIFLQLSETVEAYHQSVGSMKSALAFVEGGGLCCRIILNKGEELDGIIGGGRLIKGASRGAVCVCEISQALK